jgi:hypothetical protein
MRALHQKALQEQKIEHGSPEAEQCLDAICATFNKALGESVTVQALQDKFDEDTDGWLQLTESLSGSDPEKHMPGYLLGVAAHWNNVRLAKTALELGADLSTINPIFRSYGWILNKACSVELGTLLLESGLPESYIDYNNSSSLFRGGSRLALAEAF